MRATLGGLLLLKLVASRLTSCVNGPGWTPWADKPAKPARASSRKSHASANAPLAEGVAPVAAPAGLWPRIVRSLPANDNQVSVLRRMKFWRGATMGSLGLAVASLAMVAVLATRPPQVITPVPAPMMNARLMTNGGQPLFLAAYDPERKAVLVASVPPLMLKTESNPDGVPLEVFDGLRQASLDNRSQLYLDIASGPFFGYNRPGATPSQGLIQSFWVQGMQAGHKNTYDSIAAFSATDFREDLRKFDVPTLVIHGDDDQIVPIDTSARASASIVKDAELIIYPGAPHGLTDTHKERLNQDLLAFLRK